MPSIHAWKSIEVAVSKGGFAGVESAIPLWEMSKRELVELAVRLGCLVSEDYENPDAGVAEVLREHEALRANGIL